MTDIQSFVVINILITGNHGSNFRTSSRVDLVPLKWSYSVFEAATTSSRSRHGFADLATETAGEASADASDRGHRSASANESGSGYRAGATIVHIRGEQLRLDGHNVTI